MRLASKKWFIRSPSFHLVECLLTILQEVIFRDWHKETEKSCSFFPCSSWLPMTCLSLSAVESLQDYIFFFSRQALLPSSSFHLALVSFSLLALSDLVSIYLVYSFNCAQTALSNPFQDVFIRTLQQFLIRP
jgi:hypothetical protein